MCERINANNSTTVRRKVKVTGLFIDEAVSKIILPHFAFPPTPVSALLYVRARTIYRGAGAENKRRSGVGEEMGGVPSGVGLRALPGASCWSRSFGPRTRRKVLERRRRRLAGSHACAATLPGLLR